MKFKFKLLIISWLMALPLLAEEAPENATPTKNPLFLAPEPNFTPAVPLTQLFAMARPELEYSTRAGHLVFAEQQLHAHGVWKKSPVINQEAFLRMEFRNAKDHVLVTPSVAPTAAVWNLAYSYGLVQPSVTQAIDSEGKPIIGTFDVDGIFFLASGQWEVRVYLPGTGQGESFEAFKVDLGSVAPSPALDPKSPIRVMMPDGMNMSEMHKMHMKAGGGNKAIPAAKNNDKTKPATPKGSGMDHSQHTPFFQTYLNLSKEPFQGLGNDSALDSCFKAP